MEADYRKPMYFTAFLDWVTGRVKTLGAAAPQCVTHMIQLVVSGSDPDLHEASAFRYNLNKKSNGRIFQVVVAAVARPGNQRGQSLLQSTLDSLVEIFNLFCPFIPLILFFSQALNLCVLEAA